MIMETKDLDPAFALLCRQRGVTRIGYEGEQGGIRAVRHAVGPVSVDHLSLGMDLHAEVRPMDTLVFGQVNAGSLCLRSGGAERWYGPGDVYLAGQPWQRRTVMALGEHEQTVIDAAFISQVASQVPASEARPVRFSGYEPVSPQAASMWKSACDYARHAMLASPGTADCPLLAGNAARLIAATALAVFPNDALTNPVREGQHDSSPATLRRAVAFIDEHAHEDIAVTDIAAAAYVTVRSVQAAFRRHLDYTPTEYLRRVRLDHAHRQLVDADPEHESVTAVALRWGFSSPSRFTAAYRKAYGVLPSRSLRG